LYIEELTTAVSDAPGDSGTQSSRKIPATLQDSLLARIDRATKQAKELVQLGAVLGRRFSREYIGAVYDGDEEELDRTLTELVDHGLLQQAGRPPGPEYVFRHALIQDAAYAIILHAKRRQLHADCAEALEKHFPLLCQNDPGTLGRHHEAAGNAQAAVPYFLAAGKAAVERFALREADAYLQRGLSLLGTLSDSSWKQEQELLFRTLRGRVCIFAKGWADPSVRDEYGRALSLCETLGLSKERVPLEWALTTYHLLRGEIREAVEGGDRVLALAEKAADEDLLSVAHSALTIYRFYSGDFLSAIRHKDQALRFYKPQTSSELRQHFGTDRRLQALRGASLAHWCVGDHQIAIDLDEEQRRLAARNERPYERAYALTISCILHALRREAELTNSLAEEAIEIAGELGFSFLAANARNFRALALAMLEPSDAALEECELALGVFRGSGNRMGTSSMLAIMGEVAGRIGQMARGLGYVEAALVYVSESGERFAESDLHRVKGDLLAGEGAHASALECFERALSIARSQSANTWALAAAIPLAKAFGDAGEVELARNLLEPLYAGLRQSQHIPEHLRTAKAILMRTAA
jgi:tetratricopeptide (TPR) repeat protein